MFNLKKILLVGVATLTSLSANCWYTNDNSGHPDVYHMSSNCADYTPIGDLQRMFNDSKAGYGLGGLWSRAFATTYYLKGITDQGTVNEWDFEASDAANHGHAAYRNLNFQGYQAWWTTFNFGTKGGIDFNVNVSGNSGIHAINFARKAEGGHRMTFTIGDTSRVSLVYLGGYTADANGSVRVYLQNVTVNNNGVIGELRDDNANPATQGVGTVTINNNGTIETLGKTIVGNVNINNQGRIGNILNTRITNLTLNNNSSVGNISSNQQINNIYLNHNSSIGTLSNTSNTTTNNVHVNGNSRINNISGTFTIDKLNVNGTGYVGSITGNVGINNLVIATDAKVGTINTNKAIGLLNINGSVGSVSVNGNGIGVMYLNNYLALSNPYIKATSVNSLYLYKATINISKTPTEWNAGAYNDGNRIGTEKLTNLFTFPTTSVIINIGEGLKAADNNQYYEIANLVKDGTSGKSNTLNFNNLVAGPGTKIFQVQGKNAFTITADATTSYGSNLFRSMVVSNLRRQAMTQNILDTMTTKTFHSDNYYNFEVELRLLQYDRSRLTNRSSKYAKNVRKNTKAIDNLRLKMAKLTLEQTKGQDLDKGYNNYEVIDQLDAIFIPYTGRRDYKFFALPYTAASYVSFGKSNALEFTGGALLGIQRNLRNKGILGGYVGYEFSNIDTSTITLPTRVQTNSIQAGVTHFKTFNVPKKIWEGFIRSNIRANVDLPIMSLSYDAANGNIHKITSGDKNTAIPLVYSVGAEIKGGITFYQYKRNSYVSPEVSLSYDLIGSTKMLFNKPYINPTTDAATKFYPLGANESYMPIYWHLPQVGAAVRYYKMWGNTFRTNVRVGVKYNPLDSQKLTFAYAGFNNTGLIYLPKVYGDLAYDFIWLVKKNHELALGLNAMLYASTFDKSTPEIYNSWFNGVSGNVNFKYSYWFGGTDFVKDKDGNAVSRNMAEKRMKSTKKSSPKKKRKKKDKTVYIDG